jgi:hypothetical protein
MRNIQCQRCALYLPDNRAGAVHIAGCRLYNGWTNYETVRREAKEGPMT